MNPSRQQQYVDLITELLNCPTGEEGRVLQQHPDLLDTGLLVVMQAYVRHLEEEGHSDAARWLQGLSESLQENGSSDRGGGDSSLSEEGLHDRARFLNQLISTVTEHPGDTELAHNVLDEHVEQIDEATVEIFLRHVTDQIRNAKSKEQSSAWADVAVTVGNVLLMYPRGPRDISLEWAIGAYKAALTVYTREEAPHNWATGQNGLGTAYKDRIREDRAANLERAIDAFEKALTVYTREDAPHDWAMVQNNLGNAYSNRLRDDRAANLERAIDAFEKALTVYTREDAPHRWATVQNNLGGAYRERLREDRAANLERAIDAYEKALTVYTREAAPHRWAGVQNNLGNAYQDRIRDDRAANLERAIDAYEKALQVHTREAAPHDWAQVQNGLGGAYRERLREDRAANLERAIEAFEKALTVYTREAAPHRWATVQNNLGGAYQDRIRGERAANLERAIDAYEKALTVHTREAAPYDWAQVQNGLGNAYRERLREDRAANLERAIEAFEKALTVYTREAAPHRWATVQNNLGGAYQDRIRGERAANLERAIDAYEKALQVHTREAAPHQWAQVQNGLGNAYQERIRGERAANLERAIDAYEKALQVHTREAAPHLWARAQNNLGAAYSERLRDDRAANLERAIEAFEKALQIHTREAAPHDWAMAQNNLGAAYRQRIRGKRAANLERAIEAYEDALEVYRPDTDPTKALTIGRNLARLFREENRWEEARETLRIAVEAVEAARDEALDDQRRREIIEEAIDVYAGMVEACLRTGRPTEALAYAERSRSRTLADLLHGRDIEPSADVPDDLLEEDAALRRRIRELRRQIQSGNAGAIGDGAAGPPPDLGGDRPAGDLRRASPAPTPVSEREDLERELRDAVRRRQDVITQIGEHDPAYRQSLAATPAEFADVARLAERQDTAIVEWYQTEGRLHAFIVVPGAEAPEVVSLGPDVWEETVDAIQRYQSGYGHGWTNGRRGSGLPDLLRELSGRLRLPEIIGRIPESCRSVLLVPHRALHLLPLHALSASGESETILLDRFPDGVRYAPSAFLAGLTGALDRPDFDALWAAENPTGDLAFTELEVSHLRHHFPQASVFAREEAARPALRGDQGVQGSHCTHFACHGRFNAEAPLDSSLMLAGSELTLGEVFELQLPASRLTVLSACETGLTDITDLADEYVGLPSGFLFAGSQAVVSSLWPVSDVSTSILMMEFYDRLAAAGPGEQSVTRALTGAQQWMRAASAADLEAWAKDRHRLSAGQRLRLRTELQKAIHGAPAGAPPLGEPYHWAPFRVVGD
jgi:tetratricopeptide (TPR) repeat protein